MPAPQHTSTAEANAVTEPQALTHGVLDDAIALTRELRAQLHDHMTLIALEAERAVGAFTHLVAMTIAIGVLCVISWLGLVGAAVLALIGAGVAPAKAMFAATVLNLIAISILYPFARRARRSLRFPATLRALQPSSPDNGNAP